MWDGVQSLVPGKAYPEPPDAAVSRRLQEISQVVSSLDLAKIQTRNDMTRALCLLQLAQRCVRTVLGESPTGLLGDGLIEQSAGILEAIEAALDKLADFQVA